MGKSKNKARKQLSAAIVRRKCLRKLAKGDYLNTDEKKLLEEIKASEKEIQKLSHDLDVSSEINTEVGP